MSFHFPSYSLSSPQPAPTYQKSSKHKDYDTMINITKPIPYNVKNSLTLNRILRSCKNNFLVPQLRITYPELDEAFVSNLEKLLISLKAYYDSSNPVIPLDTLIDILCEKDSAKILKNIRIKSIMMAWNTTFVEDPDWWSETPHYIIHDIGDVFYYKYCFFWEEETDDYLRQLEPLVVNEEAVAEFIEACDSVMSELNFDFDFEPQEVLYQPRSSKVINSSFESVNDYKIRYKKSPEFRYGPRKPGKRCVVPVHPGGVRDTIINEMEDLNTILAIDKILSRCLSGHPNTIINNVERFNNKLEDFYTKFTHFYCRDIEKEGITKPRYLLKIMLKALFNKCPYFSEVCTPDFFDGDWCSIENTVIHSERGHGLGMGNSLTTLMQIILHRMTVSRYIIDHSVSEDFVDFYTLNDDCVFGLNLSEDEAFEFSQIDHEVLDDLGLIRKKTKSFLCEKGFVFLEIYFPSVLNRKESINRRTMLLPYSAVNIVHAKDLMSLMTENPYIDEILSKWGYEFYPEEINNPRHFGGWFSRNFYGVDISLDYDIEEFTGPMSRAAQAVLASDKKFKRKLIDNRDPFNLLRYDDIDPYIYHKLPLAGSNMFSHYERLRFRNDFNLIYSRLYYKRQRIYQKSKYVDLKTILTEIINSSDRDIVISKFNNGYITEFDINRFVEGVFRDPYRYNYPICSSIRKIKGIKVKDKPSSHWPITSADSTFTTSVIRSEIAEVNLDYWAFEYTDEDVVLPTREDEFKQFVNSWRNPVSVAKYCQIRKNKLLIPIMIPDVLKYKRDFFSRDLLREEFLMLQGISYKEIENYLSSGMTLEEFLDDYEERRKEIPPNEINHLPDNDSDPDDGDDFDGKSVSQYLYDKFFKKPETIISDLLPEGWDLDSFTVDDNIIYVCENQDLFDPLVIEFADKVSKKAISTYNNFLRFMKYADPQSMYLRFLRTQLEILNENELIKNYFFSNMNKEQLNDSSESENDFEGDFDVF